jgi:sugar/nucleoside kinase (ribokinase family)
MRQSVRRAATTLRRHGVSVEYALRDQQIMKQVKAAKAAGATFVLTLHDRPRDRSDDGAAGRHTWTPAAVPPEWNRLLDDIGL